jgi:hypothetical protein
MQLDTKALLARIMYLAKKLVFINQHRRCCLVAPRSPSLDESDGFLEDYKSCTNALKTPKPSIEIQPQ